MIILDSDVLTIRNLREAERNAYNDLFRSYALGIKNGTSLQTTDDVFFRWRDAVAKLNRASAKLNIGKPINEQ